MTDAPVELDTPDLLAVTWPPVLPPATRTNVVAQADQHPLDHNQTATALAAIVATMGWGVIGYVQTTATLANIGNAVVDLGVLSVSWTVPAGGRRYRTTGYGKVAMGSAVGSPSVYITDGANAIKQEWWVGLQPSFQATMTVIAVESLPAGPATRKLRGNTTGTGTYGVYGSPTAPAFIVVEDIGAP